MFGREEKKKLTQEFWTAFGKSFPRRWIMYDTKIRDFSFKFGATQKNAEVSINLEMKDPVLRKLYYGKLQGLEGIFQDALGSYMASENFTTENGRQISKIWVQMPGVSIYDKNTWRTIFEFFVEKMTAMETVFRDFEDYIKTPENVN